MFYFLVVLRSLKIEQYKLNIDKQKIRKHYIKNNYIPKYDYFFRTVCLNCFFDVQIKNNVCRYNKKYNAM